MQSKPRNGSALRLQILRNNDELSPAQLLLLDTACAAYDEALAAEKTIRREGLITTGARGPRPHPAVEIARAARHRLMRALSALNL